MHGVLTIEQIENESRFRRLLNRRITKVDREIYTRTFVALWAYAYEEEHESLVGDHFFDEVAKSINPSIETNRPHVDKFFKEVFHPCTGSWIRNHPEYQLVKRLYSILYKKEE